MALVECFEVVLEMVEHVWMVHLMIVNDVESVFYGEGVVFPHPKPYYHRKGMKSLLPSNNRCK